MLTEMEVVNERMSRAKAAEAEDVDADLQVRLVLQDQPVLLVLQVPRVLRV